MRNTSKNTKPLKGIGEKICGEFLFWGHMLIIFAFIFCGILVPLQVLVLLLILWNIQLMFLDRCVITMIQEKNQSVEQNQPFLDLAYSRFTGKHLSGRAFNNLINLIPTLALSVALAANVLNFNLI